MNDKERLLNQVRIAFFKVTEASLFLDTHPTDPKALSYMECACREFEESKAAYTEYCGPLTLCDGIGKDGWNWISAPWPWQMEV
ncbi:MAG: spore coat protein CotJB [Clostridia bacterium]|nr:spore coat protein CotJB [Clostridia bacterium]